jgi:hypothetical protein
MRSSSEESVCAICLDEKTGLLAELSCGHIYHYKCVQAWIKQKKNYLKCCCICEGNTEIVNIIGEDKLTEEQKLLKRPCQNEVNNTFVNNPPQTVTYTNTIYTYDDSYFPYYQNDIIHRNQIVPIQQIVQTPSRVRETQRPSIVDFFCCTIL